MKKAFTLSEVLIALAVIGVVVAITIPQMIVKHQKEQTVIQLKKVYSELSQACAMSKATYGDISSWDFSLSNYDFFNKYLYPFVKISSQTVSEAKNQNNIKYLNTSGSEETGLLQLSNNEKIINLASGAQIFTHSNSSYSTKTFVVDINGFKKPNKFGHDLFLISITPNKDVLPKYWDDYENASYTKTREQLKNGPSNYRYQCNKNGRGMWCAALIMADGWQIKDDYPW
jgi:prepilin-type N-terminal cleavage/methylation domain-containing protein